MLKLAHLSHFAIPLHPPHTRGQEEPTMPTQRKTAIVTGAASGMGRAMALGLSEAGFDVAAVDRNAAALGTLPAPIKPVAADLADATSFDTIVAATLGAFGRIDVLVNNAGIGQAAIRDDQRRKPLRFWEVTPEQWNRFLTVNATGPIMMSRAAGGSSPSPPAWGRWCGRVTCCTGPARRRRSPPWPCWRPI
jgi:NAD(P)-dependent dehydrogenase (short-subunit alcohol dehydrogenase family)